MLRKLAEYAVLFLTFPVCVCVCVCSCMYVCMCASDDECRAPRPRERGCCLKHFLCQPCRVGFWRFAAYRRAGHADQHDGCCNHVHRFATRGLEGRVPSQRGFCVFASSCLCGVCVRRLFRSLKACACMHLCLHEHSCGDRNKHAFTCIWHNPENCHN